MSRTLVTWMALATIAAAGCGGGGSETPSRTFITIATGGTGGTYYPLGGALAQIWSTAIPGVNASAQSTVASVFNVQAVEQGKAVKSAVQVGQRTGLQAQITSGLQAGDSVISHPDDRVRDGVRVAAR